MAQEKMYQTLKEVHNDFIEWESEEKVYNFARALWKTAEFIVLEEAEEKDRCFDSKDECADAVFLKLKSSGSLRHCLTDTFRKAIIRYHVRGISTTQAIQHILANPEAQYLTPFWTFGHRYVCGKQNIKHYLTQSVGYLKPTHPRWPEKKYGEYWRSERKEFVDALKDIPLSKPIEQLAKLQEHYSQLETLFTNATQPADKERYHKCIMRTMGAIHTITYDPSIKAQTQAITQEQPTQALEKPKENVIEISTPNVVVKK